MMKKQAMIFNAPLASMLAATIFNAALLKWGVYSRDTSVQPLSTDSHFIYNTCDSCYPYRLIECTPSVRILALFTSMGNPNFSRISARARKNASELCLEALRNCDCIDGPRYIKTRTISG